MQSIFKGFIPLIFYHPSIIVINHKHCILGSHWVAVFPSLVTPNILIRMVYHPTSFKSWYSCNATQYLGQLTATEYRG